MAPTGNPVELLQQLLRFDTTNPPGGEGPCMTFLAELLRSSGLEVLALAKSPGRPNLVVRLKGAGRAPGILLQGHLDVVTTAHQSWTVPPFSGQLQEGFVWGRGALDMKGGVAMMVIAFLRLAASATPPPGDVVLALLCDEENWSENGSKFLVAEHPDLFAGVRYALGEIGGFTLHLGGRRFYPIMVAEKQLCSIRALVRGPGGHGSIPLRAGAMSELGALLTKVTSQRLPVHLSAPVRLMLEIMGAELGPPLGAVMQDLLVGGRTDAALDALGTQGRSFDAQLHNTISPTRVAGGEALNVHPAQVTVDFDGRLLPGFEPEQMLSEVRSLVGEGPDLEVVAYEPGPPPAELSVYEKLAAIIREADPAGVPVPYLLSGVTDARVFARLGIQTFGFLPTPAPEGFDFMASIHSADERIPVEALEFGARAVESAVGRIAL